MDWRVLIFQIQKATESSFGEPISGSQPVNIVSIDLNKRNVLVPLFADHLTERIFINSILEGRTGIAFADSETNPQVAQLTVSRWTMFGGDAAHPVAQELVRRLSRTWIIPVSGVWRELIFQVHGHHLKQARGITFSPESLSLKHLRNLQKRIPFGCHIERVDIPLANRLKNEGFSSFGGFNSLADFVERGIGFCATIEGGIVSYAVSMMQCREGIEVGVGTHPEFRNKGFATAVGATLLVHCLERGIYARWSTGYENAISIHLAEKLGYVHEGVYKALGVPIQTP